MGEAVCPARDEECRKRIDHAVIVVTEIRNFAEATGQRPAAAAVSIRSREARS